MIHVDGAGLRRFTPAGVFAGSPTWSADGKDIAFYEMSVEQAFDARFGAFAKSIFDEKGGMAFAPSWSPDGEWIAFGFGIFFEGRSKPARIMKVRADGSEKQALTEGATNSGFPSFSPDGTQIVYRVLGEHERGLRILNFADGSIKTLTTEPDNFPAWSPHASVIAFTRAIDGAYDILSIRPDGMDLRRLTTAPGNDAHGVWSPNGIHILFSSARLGFKDESPLYDPLEFQPHSELFIMNADGSKQRPLTDNKDEEGTPAWQPRLTAK